MKKYYNPYNIFQKTGAVFLIVTLIWLTASAPFTINTQQNFADDDISISSPCTDGDEDCSDSSSNNAEENAPSSTNFSEEFLHELHYSTSFFTIKSLCHKVENMDVYIAYHGELHAPPPNAA